MYHPISSLYLGFKHTCFIVWTMYMFPSRNLWYDSTLHATSLPNKDLPKLIHFSYSKGSFIRHNKAYKIRIHICQYLYFQTLWSNFDLCKVYSAVSLGSLPRVPWHCGKHHAWPGIQCHLHPAFQREAEPPLVGRATGEHKVGKPEAFTHQITSNIKKKHALLIRQQYFHTDTDQGGFFRTFT